MAVETGVAVEPGRQAVVGVPVATLWRGTDAVRPVDRPVLATPPDLAGWVRGLNPDDQVYEGVLSQLLLGERVLVEEVLGDWVRVVALDQPAERLDPRGYPGWLPARQLTQPATSTVDSRRYVVDAATTALRDAPGGAVVLAEVALGSPLAAAGPARDGWLPVLPPAGGGFLWADLRDVVPVPARPASAADVLATARRLLGTTYLWGGVTGHGIDCSGLVHLAWRRYGVTLPRDAADQFRGTAPVPPGEEQPGDLYFFARPGRPVHHVGFVAAAPSGTGEGDRSMVHACYRQRRVVAEPVTGERAATLVAAHRVSVTA